MSTWQLISVRLDPWSYQNLLLKTAILQAGNPNATRSSTIRYIFRRLRFTAEQKEWYAQAVREILEAKDPNLVEALDQQDPPPVH